MLSPRLALAIWLLIEVGCSSGDLASPDSAVATVDAAVSMPDAPIGGPTAYRISSLAVVDPALWLGAGSDCTNISEYMNQQVNSQISTGAIDALIVFEPLNTTPGSSTPAELIFGECDDSHLNCSAPASSIQSTLTAMSMESGACLEVIAGTLATDNPPTVNIPTVPCSRATGQTASLELAGLRLDLVEFRLGAGYSAEAVPANLTKGLIYGFLTKTEAASAIVPGFGVGLDHFLRGGGSCADGAAYDTDTAATSSSPGWYLYLTFTASKVSFVDNR